MRAVVQGVQLPRSSLRMNSKQKRKSFESGFARANWASSRMRIWLSLEQVQLSFPAQQAPTTMLAFPCASSIKRLAGYFISPRYNNTLYMLIEQEDEDEDEEDEISLPDYDPYPTSKPPPNEQRRKEEKMRRVDLDVCAGTFTMLVNPSYCNVCLY